MMALPRERGWTIGAATAAVTLKADVARGLNALFDGSALLVAQVDGGRDNGKTGGGKKQGNSTDHWSFLVRSGAHYSDFTASIKLGLRTTLSSSASIPNTHFLRRRPT